ncbi:hypothetical protein TRFO_40487 [Tritrichomonas foetus]|uniref:Armadillo/beta-catenin-like repeat family protein n=1 Tax=Tritrichomonas foetus TaxID=1144522 RepID=A0A1J4J7M8_9EUKA|nr:hypothetical protein TRFO_40487 [Tritrichomonas foetus]|eukprot:OHS93220.1 hypothetical protein TRFO_40487 [Tritrichomonas foetus]
MFIHISELSMSVIQILIQLKKMESRVTAAAINAYINKVTPEKCLTVNRTSLMQMLDTYNEIFFDLDEELFVNDPDPDNPQLVVNVLLLITPPFDPHLDLIKAGTRYIRILSRKPANFKYFDASTARLINILFSIKDDSLSIEACHILLRTLSFLPYLKIVLQDPEALYQYLFTALQNDNNSELAVAAAAAFQSFAFHQPGKQYICGKNLHVKVISLMLERALNSPLSARLIGILHNMSSEPVVVRCIRESGAITEILEALDLKPISSLTVDAAGLVQNLAREDESRKKLLDGGVVDMLLNLTVSSDLQAQVRAVGAILNLLGPSCSDTNSLKQALARLIALSALGRAL